MKHSLDHATARVFFALWPTATGRAQLAAWRAPLKHLCGGRAMRGETLHTTLAFIGNVALHGLAVLQRAAQEVSGESFELCFDEARYWGHNHIVYAAPRHVPPQLLQLAAALEERLAAHRFEFDRREYQPHVTLLRNARWSDAPKADHPQPAPVRAELIPPLPAMQPVCWKIKNFALVQSVPGDGLRDYRVLARFPLRAGGG